MNYTQFLLTKTKKTNDIGFVADELNKNLFDFQKYIVRRIFTKL